MVLSMQFSISYLFNILYIIHIVIYILHINYVLWFKMQLNNIIIVMHVFVYAKSMLLHSVVIKINFHYSEFNIKYISNNTTTIRYWIEFSGISQ